MKLGVISQNFMQFEFEEGLQRARALGFQAMEVGACGLWGTKFCNREKLLGDPGEMRRWLDAFARYDLQISALGGHGAPLLPNREAAAEYSRQFRQTCALMEKADIRHLTLLAGLPEGAEGDTAPNWVAFAEWPFLRDTLEWQWEKRLLPYWREHAQIAADHGVTLCFEMHGGDMIHSPVTLMRLRKELGPVASCNFDIAHMWYQSIDPIEALRYLGDAVQHVHVKDTRIHDSNARLKGMMDTTTIEQPDQRSWTYTLVGWGHDAAVWRDFIATLRLIGYDHVLSVEMECEYIQVEEGLEKSVEFLKPMVLEQPPGPKWWEYVGMKRAGGLSQD